MKRGGEGKIRKYNNAEHRGSVPKVQNLSIDTTSYPPLFLTDTNFHIIPRNDRPLFSRPRLADLVLDAAGDGGEGGELVGRHLAVHPGQVGQQGRLTHRWEA